MGITMVEILVRITSMLPQGVTFTIIMVQQSMQITSMLQQEAFPIMIVQSMRITSMLPQERYFFNSDSAINANNFNVTAGSFFRNQYNSTINADNFNVTAGDYFYNDGLIVSGDARYFGIFL